jgi:PAS domain S-box-containing protein
MMAMGVLLVTQTLGLRGQWTPIMLVAAALAEVAWEIAWLAGQLNGRSYVGLFYNFGDVICFSLVAIAAAIGRHDEHTAAVDRSLESNVYGFLPALAVLIAVALLAGSTVTAYSADAWVRVVLVLLGGLLLVTRQRGVRAEIQALNQALSVRESYARITELARRSADLIVVVSETLHLTFVSPAAESVLGASPAQLTNTPATRLLGPTNEAELAVFLHSLLAGGTSNAEMEATITRHDGGLRVLAISGSNQLANRLIAGVILTLRDITVRRALERDVIAVAAHERMRLSSDIHEGLGQELSGIALLLRSAATHPIPDPRQQRECLEVIVAHVNRTIEMARDLAEELSPVHIARDSLEMALTRLVQGLHERVLVNVELESSLQDKRLDPNIADHLYRITNEAISNALKHSNCTKLRIEINIRDQTIFLTVTDNGCGIVPTLQRPAGLGLRMMHYRARVIGGILRLESASGGGTRLVVTVPLRG